MGLRRSWSEIQAPPGLGVYFKSADFDGRVKITTAASGRLFKDITIVVGVGWCVGECLQGALSGAVRETQVVLLIEGG